MFKIFKGIAFGCLFIAYPYLIYKGIASGMVWVVPTLFSAFLLRQAFIEKKEGVKLIKAGIAIVLLAGAYYMQSFTAKVLPVFIQLMLLYFFGRTLLKDKGPSFVESFVRLQFPEFPSAIMLYCRQLTVVWTAFFAMNVVIVTVLAIWAPEFWWSLYNGVIIYLLMGLLIIGEYIYRRIRFADLNILHKGIPDPMTTLKTMIINGRKTWIDIQAR